MPQAGLLFLGAGASKPFGPPTMPEYPDLFRGFLESRKPSLLETYESLRVVLGAFPQENDLEALYSILQDLNTPRMSILNPAVAYQLSVAKKASVNEMVEIISRSKLVTSTDRLSRHGEF